MAALEDHIKQAVNAAQNATADQSADVQAAAVTGAASGAAQTALPDASQRTADWIYRAAIIALIVFAMMALAGMALAILDDKDNTSPDLFLAVFTSTGAGLIGLFVKSPIQK
jgi:hypothetical protein